MVIQALVFVCGRIHRSHSRSSYEATPELVAKSLWTDGLLKHELKERDMALHHFASLLVRSLASAADDEFPIAPIPGLKLTRGETLEVKGSRSPLMFQFHDGRICLYGEYWSADGGKTWEKKPGGPQDKMVFDFGDGEILSVKRDIIPRRDGKFTVHCRRSTDNWKTVKDEEDIADVPLATSSGSDNAGPRTPGMMMHHGIVRLKSGVLLATLYGNYKGDNILCDAYPPELGCVNVARW
jgi:hypothetical protein